MRYSEIIHEGRDAPLYHGTGVGAAIRILIMDEIMAKTDHDGAKFGQSVRYLDGVSLTRDRQYAAADDISLELDQRRLAQSHRLLPLNYWQDKSTSARNMRAHHLRGMAGPEAEEFCLGPIRPLSRYLLAIHLSAKRHQWISRNFSEESADILLQHPLLKIDGVPLESTGPIA